MSNIDFRSGDLRGRLAGMVGASWKGIAYIRKMVIPANPNTAGQQGTRTVFAWLVDKGRRINSTILKTFLLPTPKKMSAFNAFISRNKDMIDAGAVTIGDMVIGAGGLFVPPNFACIATLGEKILEASWDIDLQGEALATDLIILVAYNLTRDRWLFKTDPVRGDSNADIDDAAMLDGDVYHIWMFATQGTTLNSETSYATDTAAA